MVFMSLVLSAKDNVVLQDGLKENGTLFLNIIDPEYFFNTFRQQSKRFVLRLVVKTPVPFKRTFYQQCILFL
jgi:hypothetical protein